MPSYATVWEYTCGHTEEFIHDVIGDDGKVLKDILPTPNRCRACISRAAALSPINPTIASLSENALSDFMERVRGMSLKERKRCSKTIPKRVTRPRDAKAVGGAVGEWVACP
ncbi:54s ribosomal protein l31 [Apiospora arundinis]